MDVLAIELRRVAGVDSCTVSLFSGSSHLDAAIRCFPCDRQALYGHWCWCVLRFCHVELPSANGVVSAERADCGDCKGNERLGEKCSHLPVSFEFLWCLGRIVP